MRYRKSSRRANSRPGHASRLRKSRSPPIGGTRLLLQTLIENVREPQARFRQLVAYDGLHVVDVQAVDIGPEICDLAGRGLAAFGEHNRHQRDVQPLVYVAPGELVRFPGPFLRVAFRPAFSLAAVQPLNVTFDTVGQLCVVQVQRGHDAAVPEGVQIPGFSDWLDLLTVAAQVGVGNSVQRLMHVAYEMDQITERVPVADTRWCAMGELAGKNFDARRDAVLTGAAFGNISFGILQSQVDVVPIGGSRCFRFVGPGGGAGHGIGDRGWGVANAKELSHTEPGAGFQVISGDTRDGSVAG